MKLEEFEKIVAGTVRTIPKKFKLILKKEKIKIISRVRPPLAVQKESKKVWIFGMFFGAPYGQDRVYAFHEEPTRIELYKESFEKAFKVRREMTEEIRKTVLHEIGHYFGMSEEELEKHWGALNDKIGAEWDKLSTRPGLNSFFTDYYVIGQ